MWKYFAKFVSLENEPFGLSPGRSDDDRKRRKAGHDPRANRFLSAEEV